MSYHRNEYKCYVRVFVYEELSLIELNLGRQMIKNSFPEQSLFQKRRESLIFQSVCYTVFIFLIVPNIR